MPRPAPRSTRPARAASAPPARARAVAAGPFADAYPLAREGLTILTDLLDKSGEEQAAYFAGLSGAEIAHAFLACVQDVGGLIDQVVRPNLNTEARDRFQARGSTAVVDALRAHERESEPRRAHVRALREQHEVAREPAEWQRTMAAHERAYQSALRQQEKASQELAAAQAQAMALHGQLRARLAEGDAVAREATRRMQSRPLPGAARAAREG